MIPRAPGQPGSTGRSKPPPILLAGPPGWVSGSCPGPGEPPTIPELTLADLAAIARDHPSWAVDAAPSGYGVEAVRGDVHLWAYSPAELAALLDLADPMAP